MYKLNVYSRNGFKYLSTMYANDTERDWWGKVTEKDGAKWVGKIDIDITKDVPELIFKEVKDAI
jgi:hypothetical protein